MNNDELKEYMQEKFQGMNDRLSKHQQEDETKFSSIDGKLDKLSSKVSYIIGIFAGIELFVKVLEHLPK